MTVKCPKCQTDNPDSLKFCGECGTRLIPLAKDVYAGITEILQTPVKELTTGSTFANRYQVIEELGAPSRSGPKESGLESEHIKAHLAVQKCRTGIGFS